MTLNLKPLVRRTLEIDFQYNHRHLPGSLAALPIIADIYSDCQPEDVFILSSGHCCAALYAVLESKGLHPDCSKIHPERDIANGIVATTGSLGHGLPMAVGIALARTQSGEAGLVRVLMGDGELAEGTTLESMLLINALGLRNLSVHISLNGTGCLGKLPLNTPAVLRMADTLDYVNLIGHDTVKGFGIPSLEGTMDHVHVYDETKYKQYLQEVNDNKTLL